FLVGSSRSRRRIATVTISAPEASSASRMSSAVRYFPVPSMRRERTGLPAMTNWSVAVCVATMVVLSSLRWHYPDPVKGSTTKGSSSQPDSTELPRGTEIIGLAVWFGVPSGLQDARGRRLEQLGQLQTFFARRYSPSGDPVLDRPVVHVEHVRE